MNKSSASIPTTYAGRNLTTMASPRNQTITKHLKASKLELSLSEKSFQRNEEHVIRKCVKVDEDGNRLEVETDYNISDYKHSCRTCKDMTSAVDTKVLPAKTKNFLKDLTPKPSKAQQSSSAHDLEIAKNLITPSGELFTGFEPEAPTYFSATQLHAMPCEKHVRIILKLQQQNEFLRK